jgi:acetyl esterase/lipase
MTARRAYMGGRRMRVPPAVMRVGARQLGRRCLNPAKPWAVQRARLEQLDKTMLMPRGTTVTERTVRDVRVYVVAPSGHDPRRSVIHFHGGGYCLGSARTAMSWAAHLSAQALCSVTLPEYRLAPEHPYPAALEDARAVMTALSGEVKPASLVLSGDSAGGGLALALLLSMRDDGQQLPAGAVLLSPWLDLDRDRRARADLVRKDVLLSPAWLEACASAYAGPPAWADGLVSPLHAAHGGLPPLLIQAGTDELLAPDAEELAASAAAAGVDVTYTRWPGMWHDFMLQPGLLAAADSALEQVSWFVAERTASAAGE